MTTPQLPEVAAELYSSGKREMLVPILHELSKHTDLAPLLINDHSPFSVLKKALRQWFLELLPPQVEKALDFELVFIAEPDNSDYTSWEFNTEPGDCVLLFRLNSVFVDDFSIQKTVMRYELESPGLGQKILHKIEMATPFAIGTPRMMFDFVCENCWCGYDSEKEYLDEIIEGEKPEDRAEVRESLEAELFTTHQAFNDRFAQWILSPDENCFSRTIPAELKALFQLPEHRYRHTDFPYGNGNLPGILIWQDELLYDCFDHIYNQLANDGLEVILNGVCWNFGADKTTFPEVFNEIKIAVSSLGKLLLILNKLHVEEENHGCDHSERDALSA